MQRGFRCQPDSTRLLWKILRCVLGGFGTCLFFFFLLNAFCCGSIPVAVMKASDRLQLELAREAENEAKRRSKTVETNVTDANQKHFD